MPLIMINSHADVLPSGRGTISPDYRQFVCQNLTDGIQRHSLIKRAPGVKHDHLLSVGNEKNLFYGLDFLDRRTLLTGHNNGYIIVVRDTGRMNSSQRYDTQYIQLNKGTDGKTLPHSYCPKLNSWLLQQPLSCLQVM
jgi:hypothetical protein